MQVYGEPTVILAQRVTGEEEVPEGAVAVVTPDAPDVLSHVSVRARNMKVLFAICHDPEELAKVRPPLPARAPTAALETAMPGCMACQLARGLTFSHAAA